MLGINRFFYRVATHSGNFQIVEILRETRGSFKIEKISGVFFSEFRIRLSKPSFNIRSKKNCYIYFK